MTFAMDLVVQMNKNTPFKALKCGYTYNGVKATVIDSRDGQEYNVEIIPNGITLSPEAMDNEFNLEAMEVQDE